MSNKKPKIICITGPDGSGKSTLIGHLVNELSNAIEVTIWDAFNNKEVALFSNKKDVDNYLCLLSPDARTLFLSHALKYAIDKAFNSGIETIFLNAYYYKYFASETALGANKTLLKMLASTFPVPDITIFLSISPEISVSRKKCLSRYECGCREATLENFINFQKKSHTFFQDYIQSEWFELNADNTPKTLKENALKIIGK